MSLLRNARTFLVNEHVRRHYIEWCLRRAMRTYPVVRLANGVRIRTARRFNDYYAVVKQHPGDDEIRLYGQLLRPEQVFIDVGANVGMYTVLANAIAHPSRIVAFEPTPRYCAIWRENVAANHMGNAVLYEAAASDRAGTALFLMNPAEPLNNRLAPPDARDSTRTISVTTTTLDLVCDDLAIPRVNFLKVDVEGAEPRVLRGASRLLSQRAIEVIYLEFIVEFMERLGEDPYAFVTLLDGSGYDLFEILPEGRLGRRLPPQGLVDGRRVAPDAPERDFAELNLVARPRP